MKFTKIFYFFCVSVSMIVFSNCTDPDIVMKAEEELFSTAGAIISATNVTSGFFDLGDLDNANYSATLVANGEDVSSGEVFISRNGGDEVSLGTVSSFPSDLTITLSEAASALGITPEEVAVGDNFSLAFESTTPSNTYRTGNRVNIVASCTSMLDGTYSYVQETYFCGGDATSGEVIITATGAGVYTFSDWAFGSYEVCYGGPAAGWGSLEMTDVCNTLTFTGADNYGDGWAISGISTSGAEFTFTWSNDYGESGTVTLTNPDGDWPPLK